MLYIVSSLLAKAIRTKDLYSEVTSTDDLWKKLILLPEDYSGEALRDKDIRNLMSKIELEHGGEEFDQRYPDGIPTKIQFTTDEGEQFDSGLVMYPAGHARNEQADLNGIMKNKFQRLGALGLS
jgi:2-methylcitrate dehydratase